ncbi:hypothetical protein JW848_10660 [Candidatus Bipolaricaulota bacterium]|nr:hypothetical protein [Candidatus Bipolaricaulota bacterium]
MLAVITGIDLPGVMAPDLSYGLMDPRIKAGGRAKLQEPIGTGRPVDPGITLSVRWLIATSSSILSVPVPHRLMTARLCLFLQ